MGHHRSAQDRYLLRVAARSRCRPAGRPPASAPADEGTAHGCGNGDVALPAVRSLASRRCHAAAPGAIAHCGKHPGDGCVYAGSAWRQGPRGVPARACCARRKPMRWLLSRCSRNSGPNGILQRLIRRQHCAHRVALGHASGHRAGRGAPNFKRQQGMMNFKRPSPTRLRCRVKIGDHGRDR